jgi:hypothetical protein
MPKENQEGNLLSPAELTVLLDQSYMPLKFSAFAKLERFLSELRDGLAEDMGPVASKFPPEFDVQAGKISRGENYNFFPYRVLDFPRAHHEKNFFTFRTLILWGHHITFHLILIGKYKTLLQERLFQAAKVMPEAFSLSKQASPWEWEFIPEQFIQARAMQEEVVADMVRNSDFLKITFLLPLKRYHEIPKVGREIWKFWQMIMLGEEG